MGQGIYIYIYIHTHTYTHTPMVDSYCCMAESIWVKLLSCVWLFATPWTVACQSPPSMGFSRQEYWNGLPFPSPGYLSDPGIKSRSPALQADSLPSEPPANPWWDSEVQGIVYLWLIHIVVWQKPIQHYKAVTLQLKIKKRSDVPPPTWGTATWESQLWQLRTIPPIKGDNCGTSAAAWWVYQWDLGRTVTELYISDVFL